MSNIRSTTAKPVVALFNASDDTVEMVQRMLAASGIQCLGGAHFAALKTGKIDFARYLATHNPQVVIVDLSPPYDENWAFFKTMRDSDAMQGRGLVLTTTNKMRLDEVLGDNSFALEIVGRTADLAQINAAIKAETAKASASRLAVA